MAAPLLFSPARGDVGQVRTGFFPPASPMILTRALIRQLSGGDTITVRRAWRVLFTSNGAGFSLDGTQVSVDVQAPTGLAALARLEERKIESGLFPLALSPGGVILGDRKAGLARDIDAAIAHAIDRIEHSGLPLADKQASDRFLRAIQQSAARAANRLPRDLFYPQLLDREQRRIIALPGGAEGDVTIRFSAELSRVTGILGNAERRVTTTIGQSSRASIETWELQLQ